MVFSLHYIMCKQKMQANCWQFWLSCGCGGEMRGASPDGAHPGLHLKPQAQDAASGQVLALHWHCRGGRHRWRFWPKTQITNKKLFLASLPMVDQSQKLWQFRYPKLDPLLSSSMQQATSFILNVKHHGGAKELGYISLYQTTLWGDKNWKVIKLTWSLIYKLAHTCATSGIAVNGP